MKSRILKAELATISQLFEFKKSAFSLEPFPGYSDDQWGIKAHNRPWVESVYPWKTGENVMEVGGAFSTFPAMLAHKYGVKSWVADDFGEADGTTAMWQRWGDPKLLPEKYPNINYVFRRMGDFTPELPDAAFDCIFSISTLEHIPEEFRVSVLKDIDRCLKPGGYQIHTIDVDLNFSKRQWIKQFMLEKLEKIGLFPRRCNDDISKWLRDFEMAGYMCEGTKPLPTDIIGRNILVESADVVYRLYPPNNEPKNYRPNASLLVVARKSEAS